MGLYHPWGLWFSDAEQGLVERRLQALALIGLGLEVQAGMQKGLADIEQQVDQGLLHPLLVAIDSRLQAVVQAQQGLEQPGGFLQGPAEEKCQSVEQAPAIALEQDPAPLGGRDGLLVGQGHQGPGIGIEHGLEIIPHHPLGAEGRRAARQHGQNAFKQHTFQMRALKAAVGVIAARIIVQPGQYAFLQIAGLFDRRQQRGPAGELQQRFGRERLVENKGAGASLPGPKHKHIRHRINARSFIGMKPQGAHAHIGSAGRVLPAGGHQPVQDVHALLGKTGLPPNFSLQGKQRQLHLQL